MEEGKKEEREKEREQAYFYLLAYSPNAHAVQNRPGQNLGCGNSLRVAHMSVRGPTA